MPFAIKYALSNFGVDVRYPDDLYNPSEREVLEYKILAVEIKELTESKISIILNAEQE